MKQHKAYLIKENKIVFVDSIHWNKGYGGALQIHVDNPEFDIIRDVIDVGITDEIKNPFKKEPFFTYINHTLEAHLKDTPHEFILLRPTDIQDKNDVDLHEGDLIKYSDMIGHIKYAKGCFLIEWYEDVYATLLGWENWGRGVGYDKSKIERVGSIHDKK